MTERPRAREALYLMDRLRPLSLAHRAAAAACVVAVVLAAPDRAFAQGPAAGDAGKARELHQKGRAAYQAGDMRGAYEAYSAAWALQKTFDVAANLGAVELATARFRDAAEHLTYALAHLPVSGEGDKQRAPLVSLLSDARKQVGAITIKVKGEKLAVTVDGRSIGESPIKDEIFVDPGPHVIAATGPGLAPDEKKLSVEKGASLTVELAPRPVDTHAPPPAPGPSPITVAGFVTAGVGFGLGTALAIVAKIKSDDAAAQYQALESKGANACAGASPSAACTALHNARAGRDTFANGALWTFVGAGVVTAGTLVYTFALPKSAPRSGSVSAVPVVSPEGGGLLVRGTF